SSLDPRGTASWTEVRRFLPHCPINPPHLVMRWPGACSSPDTFARANVNSLTLVIPVGRIRDRFQVGQRALEYVPFVHQWVPQFVRPDHQAYCILAPSVDRWEFRSA